MHEIYELKEALINELKEYGRKGEIKDVGALDIVDKLAHATKNLCKILDAAEEEEYSGYAYADGNTGTGNMGGGGNRGGRGSYAGRRNARRDSMGRYSRNYRNYDNYSRNDEIGRMVDDVNGMMDDLPEDVRKDAQRFVQKLEQQMMG